MASERTIQPVGHARLRQRSSFVRRRGTTFETDSLSAATYLAALDAATDGVLLINRAGVIVYANAAAESYFSDSSLTGQYFAEVSRLERRTLYGIWRELHRRGRWCGPLCVRNSSPDLDVTVQRVNSETDTAEHYCVVLHGAARLHSEDSSRNRSSLQRVASEIAHDFNNQIAVILNYSFVLLRHMPVDSPLKAHVTEMQAAAWRASQVAQAIHRALVTHTLLPSLPGGK